MDGSSTGIGWGGVAIVLVVVVAAAVFFFLSGEGEPDALTRAHAGGPIRIGYANEEPYGYLDADSGRVTGEAPEIARVILERMGVETIEPVVARFGELIPALKAGQLDIVAAGMYVKPERCKEILFSEPTYRVGEGFVVAQGNPLDLHGYEDVAGSDEARIGVMGGSVEHGYAKEYGIPEDRIKIYEDYQTALVGLDTGRVDAVAATEFTVDVLLRKAKSGAYEKAQPFQNPVIDGETTYGYGAFGFRKGDEQLRDEFNEELEAFIGTPEHLELIAPFGFDEENLPGDVTTADLCAR